MTRAKRAVVSRHNVMRVACCATVLATATAAAPDDGTTVRPLVTGTFVTSSFTANHRTVNVEAAVFPRDRVTVRIVEYPLGGPPGEMVRRAFRPGVVAAVTGGFAMQGNRPRGLLEIGGTVHEPPRAGLSGVVGSTTDDAPVVATLDAVSTAALKDAVQAGPFVIDPGGKPGIRRDDGERQRRALVILSADEIGVVYTSACTLYELMNGLLQSPQAFGVDRVERALNMSGGASAGFAVRLPSGIVEGVPESFRVRSVVTIQERMPAPR